MTKGGGGSGGRQPSGPNQPASPRVAPHDLQAEQALLGAALLTSAAHEILATKLRVDDFFSINHQHIAAALTDALEAGEKADPVDIADRLKRQGVLDQVGGLAALQSLQVNTPATSNAGRYAAIIHDHATLRRLIGSAGEIADLGYQIPDDVHEAVERAQLLLADVAANNGGRSISTLEPFELAGYLLGDVQLEEPELLRRNDGAHLIYPGKINGFHGAPSVGKGWVCLKACVEVLEMGGTVVYLDYEDSPRSIADRLGSLGVGAATANRCRYYRPSGPFTIAERTALKAAIDTHNPDLVVIDGVAEAMTRDGYDETSNTDIPRWIDNYPRWIARQGPAVILIDHVPKDPEHPRGARGGGHKLAAVDGASYEVTTLSPFSRHKPGSLRIKVDKDRLGVYAIGEIAAIVRIEPAANGKRVDIRVEAPNPEGGTNAAWKPTRIMETVSREIEQSQAPMPPNLLKSIIHADPKLVEKAISHLVKEGHITTARRGRTAEYVSVNPYRSPDDTHTPPPEEPEQRDLTDVGLFDDIPDPTIDELAQRRQAKHQEDNPE